MKSSDSYGTVVTFRDPESLTAWNAAMNAHAIFTGDPGSLIAATDDDPEFALGLVYRVAMQLRGGMPVGPELRELLARVDALAPSVSASEKLHIEAVQLMAAGETSRAGDKWNAILRAWPHDFLALKLSHDAFFLRGDIDSMLASSRAQVGRLKPDAPSRHVALSQLAFALEESGEFEAAEHAAKEALSIEERDCWALHCLAHVYESEGRHAESLAFLESYAPIWRKQNMLDPHIWWHLALRYIECGEHDQALTVFDEQLSRIDAANAWRLTDATSLLWRLELAGIATGDRWRAVALKWAGHAARHQNAFLNVHAAMAFSHVPDLPEAVAFFRTLTFASDGEASERASIFRNVALPLAEALRLYVNDAAAAAEPLLAIMPGLSDIGGSKVQRDLVERTCSAALLAAGDHDGCERFLDALQGERPIAAWILSHRAVLARSTGDGAAAARFTRQAQEMTGKTVA
jgi:tetratricopeptide (TPR) repeat protein